MSDPGQIGSANIGATCALFDERGRVLLVHHTYGNHDWNIPGGIALPGESPLAAARRELREETMLSVEGGQLSGVYFEAAHHFGPMLHFVYRFEVPGNADPRPQPPEIEDAGWFDLEHLPLPISDFTERRIRDALAPTGLFDVVTKRVWRK